MAKQEGTIKLIGTIDNITFYKDGDQHLARKKSSLDKKRVKKDPAFANSRKASEKFGQVATLAQEIYYSFPKRKRKHGVFGSMTGMANRLIHQGKTPEEIKSMLTKKFG